MIACSKSEWLVSCAAWFSISLGLIGFTVYGMVAGQGAFLLPSDEFYISAILFFAIWVVVSASGLYANAKQAEYVLIFFIIMTLLVTVLAIAAFVFLMLYLNNIETFAELDSNAFTLQTQAENKLFSWILANPQAWIVSQNDFNCCGYDFASLVAGRNMATGSLCQSNVKVLADPGCTTWSTQCQTAFFAKYQVPETFFCKDKLVSYLRIQSVPLGIVGGLVIFIMIVALISSVRMYWVPYYQGGFWNDNGSKNTSVLPQQQKQQMQTHQPQQMSDIYSGGGPPNSRFGQSIRNFGNYFNGGNNFNGNGGFMQNFGNRVSARFFANRPMFGNTPPV